MGAAGVGAVGFGAQLPPAGTINAVGSDCRRLGVGLGV